MRFVASDVTRVLHGYGMCPVYNAMIRMLRYQETVGVKLQLSSFLYYFYSSVSVAPVFCTAMGRVMHAVHDNSKPGICEYRMHEVM